MIPLFEEGDDVHVYNVFDRTLIGEGEVTGVYEYNEGVFYVLDNRSDEIYPEICLCPADFTYDEFYEDIEFTSIDSEYIEHEKKEWEKGLKKANERYLKENPKAWLYEPTSMQPLSNKQAIIDELLDTYNQFQALYQLTHESTYKKGYEKVMNDLKNKHYSADYTTFYMFLNDDKGETS